MHKYRIQFRVIFNSLIMIIPMAATLYGCQVKEQKSNSIPNTPNTSTTIERTKHPGLIEFVNEEDGSSEQSPFDSVPDSIAWYGTGDNRIPVVRIVHKMRGGQHVIQSYGPSGKLLKTTTSKPAPTRLNTP